MDLALTCDFEGPGSDPCLATAEVRGVPYGAGDTVQVALCDTHFAYVADKRHAHYWVVDHGPARARTFIRMVREHD